MPYTYTHELSDSLRHYLRRNRRNFIFRDITRTEYPIPGRDERVIMDIRIGEDGCYLSSVLSRKADPRHTTQMYRCSKLLNQINSELRDEWASLFVMNFYTGEIRLRSFLPTLEPQTLERKNIVDRMEIAEEILDRYIEGFLMILCDGSSDSEAYEACRKNWNERNSFHSPRRPVRRRARGFAPVQEEEEDVYEEDEDLFSSFIFNRNHPPFHGFPGFEETEEEKPEESEADPQEPESPESEETGSEEEDDDELLRSFEEAIDQAIAENEDLFSW